ncbi:hypothetical protein CL630_01655 [bacterium]|nr:hypothetical protein [bacterium]|tara:strand:+ start:20951 stop:21211 length:261 start_codon:yes stop_codon:yes gene_type:complete
MHLYLDFHAPYNSIKKFVMEVFVDPHKALYKEVVKTPQSLAGVVGRWIGVPIMIFVHIVCIVVGSLIAAIPTLLIYCLSSVKIEVN